MGTITDIKTGIEASLAIIIPSYSKLSYQTDVAQNKFKGNNSQYAVHPVSASEVDSLLGAFTMDHTFSVTLTNSYNAGAVSNVSDSLKSSRITELNDDILATYRYLSVNKGTIDSSILIINGLDIQEAEFIEESKIITVTFNINIKYKINK